jgi:hypothetical protein
VEILTTTPMAVVARMDPQEGAAAEEALLQNVAVQRAAAAATKALLASRC